jgi:hypothetical protein
MLTDAVQRIIRSDPYSWLRERDIDLLLCSELYACGIVNSFIAGMLGARELPFLGAWVSHTDTEGESDLVACYGDQQQLVIGLVENKIQAPFQPDQALRYLQRRDRLSLEPGVSSVVTILVAPSAYMSRSDVALFDKRCSYEEIAAIVESDGDNRSRFFAANLLKGAEAAKRGYVMNPDAAVSAVWQALWETASSCTPFLNMERPSAKPGRSTWIYFKSAQGFSLEDRKQAVIAWKAERGQVDLQFSGTTPEELMLCAEGLLEPDMKVVQASKSSSIRIEVPMIDFNAHPAAQNKNMVVGLVACERLRQLFAVQKISLLGRRG